jgi:hypothetical protein
MSVAGMVYMGEYSNACICQWPPRPGAPAAMLNSDGALGATVAVVMQQRRLQAQQQTAANRGY